MRRLKKLGLFFLILLIAAAVGLFILHRIGVSKLASRGGGTIPTADELVYPELTDAENAAILYRAARKALEATPEGTTDASQTLISEYTKTILARIAVGEEPEETLSESDIGAVAVLLAEADPAFEFLKQVRDTKGSLFHDDYSPQALLDNQEEMLDIYTWMRGLARYVAARALWEAEQGNTDAALDWVTTGLHMANDINDDSVLFGELIKVAIAEITLSAAQGILYDHPVSEPIRQALLYELNDLRDRSRYGDSLRREAVFGEAMAQAQGGGWLFIGILRGNYFETLGEFIKAVEVDDYTERTRMLDEISNGVAQSSQGFTKFLHIYESIIMPALIRSDEALERTIAKADLLELALSLRAYEQTHGAFPDTLAELTPEFLPAIPEDPLNGKAYLYEKSDERVTVRSEETTRRGKEIAFHLAPLANTPEAQ